MSTSAPVPFGGPGGAAMYRGGNYQATVAAYFATLALAETRNGVPPEIAAPAPPTRVGAEQHWPVDDTAVWFGDDATAFLQAKASIGAADLPDVVVQFVGQVVHGGAREPGTPLRPDDRLVLVLEEAPEWIRKDLRDLLRRLSDLAPNEPVAVAFQGEARLRAVYRRVAPMVRNALTGAAQPTDDARVLDVLRAARVWRKAADDLRAAATQTLEHYVVADRAQAQGALAVLEHHFAQAGEQRRTSGVTALRRLLRDAGIDLQAPPEVVQDVTRLTAATAVLLDGARAGGRVRTHEGDVRIRRRVTTALTDALATGNVALVGEAGGGKSVVLAAAAARLVAAGERVVFIDATDPSAVDPRVQLGLAHRFADVLNKWADDGRAAYLFVDGLDRTRVGQAYDAIVRLLRELRVRGSAVHAAIATREYDLEYAPELREELPVHAAIPDDLRDDAHFRDVAHVFVRGLDDAELAQVAATSPSLGALLASAPFDALRLLRNPFNLSIAADLTRDGKRVDLSAVHDRTDLMRLWWDRRIRDVGALAKERVLRDVARAMIDERRLRIPSEVLRGDQTDLELLSEGVLARLGRDGQDVAFGHAVIFDYVVARLLLARAGTIVALLGDDRDAFLFVLASIRMRFVELWRTGRNEFYTELASLFRNDRQRRTLLLVAARIVVENVETADDVVPLLDSDEPSYIAAVRFVVRNVIHLRSLGMSLVGVGAGPWARIALEMAHRLPRHEHDVLLLLNELLAVDEATPAQTTLIAEAARRALAYELDREPYDERLVTMAIDAFLASYDADPAASRPLLERLLDPRRLAEYAKYELRPIAVRSKYVHDPEALVAIYEAAFSEIPVPEGQLAIGAASVVLNFTESAAQRLLTARYTLGQRFNSFLACAPAAAVRVFAGVTEREGERWRHCSTFEVMFEGHQLRLCHDASNLWHRARSDHEPWGQMARAFEQRLQESVAAQDDFLDVTLGVLEAHARTAFPWRLVVRNAGAGSAAAARLAPFVAQTPVLLARELGEPVAQFLANGYAILPPAEQATIDAAILELIAGNLDDDGRHWREGRVREFADAIGADRIASNDLRAFATRRDPRESPEDVARRRALALSGSYVGRASSRHLELLDIVPTDAKAALGDHFAAADSVLHASTQGGATAEQTAAIPGLIREFDLASRAANAAARATALDVIAALVRISLSTLSAAERDEFLPLILEGVRREEPPTDEESHDDNWGILLSSPHAVDDGVQVLGPLYALSHDDRLIAALRDLSRHPRSSIRAVAVNEATRLCDADPELVWEIAEHAAQDPSLGVAFSALNAASPLASSDVARFARLRWQLFDRFVPGDPKSDYVRALVLEAVLSALEGDAEGRRRIDPILNEPERHEGIAETIIFHLSNRLARGDDRLRRAAARALTELAERLIARLSARLAELGNIVQQYPEPHKSDTEAELRLVHEIAQRIYFASGALVRPNEPGDTGEVGEAMFALLQPILNVLASIRFAASTYNVVRTLLGAIRAQPLPVLTLGIQTITSGIASGLAQDSLAEDDVRAFVVRYIDGYRGLLEADPVVLGGIMDIVDAYVDAGWPRWIDVVLKLDTIYRGD